MLPDQVSNPGPLTYESGVLPIALRGPASGEEVDFVVFAIFSNGSHLGFLTGPNFRILKPWSLFRLHVKFNNNWCNGFREKSCLKLFKYVIFRHTNWSKITQVNIQ